MSVGLAHTHTRARRAVLPHHVRRPQGPMVRDRLVGFCARGVAAFATKHEFFRGDYEFVRVFIPAQEGGRTRSVARPRDGAPQGGAGRLAAFAGRAGVPWVAF